MFDVKGTTEQFIQYLQSYYGKREDGLRATTQTANVMKIPIFQDGLVTEGVGLPESPLPPEQPPAQMAQQLNGMFPGPYDPMRLN
jgi:hypothetical protein